MERGWQDREQADRTRVAGIRTFALIALFGGGCAWLADAGVAGAWPAGLVALAALFGVAYHHDAVARADYGLTTEVAALLTFVLGSLPVFGWTPEALAAAVVATTLLSFKQQLHGWLRRIEPHEWLTALQLLVIGAVVLPLLPARPVDPWQVINPREIGWLVLLIATIGFAGYVAVKFLGARRGLLAGGLFGGLVSSTAVVLQWSPLLRSSRSGAPLISAGMLAACAVMGPRVLLLTSLVEPALFRHLILPLSLLFAMLLAAIGYGVWRGREQVDAEELGLANPTSLWRAVGFGALMVVVAVVLEATRRWLGDCGLYAAAAFGGIADVDAISLSLSRMAIDRVAPDLAARAVVVALAANSLVKAALAATVGGRTAWPLVSAPLIASATLALIAVTAGSVAG